MQTFHHPTTLGDLRREAGMTQQALSNASGIGLSTIQKAELASADVRNIRLGTAYSLSKALGLSLDTFFEKLS